MSGVKEIDILNNLVKRFKNCVVHAGSDPEFADAAVVHEVAAIATLRRISELLEQFEVGDTDELKHRLEDHARWRQEHLQERA